VSRFLVYPKYDPTMTYLHNLALIKLDERLTWSNYLQAIALPPNQGYSELMYRGDFVVAYGYGSATALDTGL
jgi:hypothetical protein